jgi:hypothetical protein
MAWTGSASHPALLAVASVTMLQARCGVWARRTELVLRTPGAFTADDAPSSKTAIALFDLEVDVAWRPDLPAPAVAAIGLAELERRIRLALQLGDPAVDVFAQGAAADEAEAVVLAAFLTSMAVELRMFVRGPYRWRAARSCRTRW